MYLTFNTKEKFSPDLIRRNRSIGTTGRYMDDLIINGKPKLFMSTPFCRELTAKTLVKVMRDEEAYKINSFNIHYILGSYGENLMGRTCGTKVDVPMWMFTQWVFSLVSKAITPDKPITSEKLDITKELEEGMGVWLSHRNFKRMYRLYVDGVKPTTTVDLQPKKLKFDTSSDNRTAYGSIYNLPIEWCKYIPITSLVLALPRLWAVSTVKEAHFGERKPHSIRKIGLGWPGKTRMNRAFMWVQAQYGIPFWKYYEYGRGYLWAFLYLLREHGSEMLMFMNDTKEFAQDAKMVYNGFYSFIRAFLLYLEKNPGYIGVAETQILHQKIQLLTNLLTTKPGILSRPTIDRARI